MSTCSYELYALKYAESMAPHGTRFYGNDPHDGPTPMDFFLWAAVSPERTVAIDCGFTAETAARRGRVFLHTPAEGLREARYRERDDPARYSDALPQRPYRQRR